MGKWTHDLCQVWTESQNGKRKLVLCQVWTESQNGKEDTWLVPALD